MEDLENHEIPLHGLYVLAPVNLADQRFLRFSIESSHCSGVEKPGVNISNLALMILIERGMQKFLSCEVKGCLLCTAMAHTKILRPYLSGLGSRLELSSLAVSQFISSTNVRN